MTEQRWWRQRIDALGSLGNGIHIHQDVFDDLAEAKRHDRKVITAHAQRWRTECKSRERARGHRQAKRAPETQLEWVDLTSGNGKHIRTDGGECSHT